MLSFRDFQPHLLLKEVVLPEISLLILSLSFLSKREIAYASYYRDEADNGGFSDTYDLLCVLEDRRMNPVVMSMMADSFSKKRFYGGIAPVFSMKNCYREACALFKSRDEESLSVEELFHFGHASYGRGYNDGSSLNQEAIRLYKLCALRLFKPVFYLLGKYYEYHRERNFDLAVVFYVEGASLGCPRCMQRLGQLPIRFRSNEYLNELYERVALTDKTAAEFCHRRTCGLRYDYVWSSVT